MIDMHSHILPGIDDGAQTLEDSLALARQAWQDGTTAVMLTPHAGGEIPACLSRRSQALQTFLEAWRQEGCPLQFHLGLECYLQDHILDDVLKYPECFCQNRRKVRLLLLELPWKYDFRLLPDVLFQAQRRDITLILAHPERYDGFLHQSARLAELLERGLYLQFNADSLAGGTFRGWRQRRKILHLIAEAPSQMLLGSDAHDQHARPARLSPARSATVKSLGEAVWQQLSTGNASRLLGL
ncbi:MAG: hypothetical protein GX564_10705 [Oligosphaeraceae bacterium]|nr:hypothetical protein [Oligosphaeraceae bacterium]